MWLATSCFHTAIISKHQKPSVRRISLTCACPSAFLAVPVLPFPPCIPKHRRAHSSKLAEEAARWQMSALWVLVCAC